MDLKKRHFKLKFKFRLFLSVAGIFLFIALFVSLLFSMTSLKNAKENDYRGSAMVLERISSQIASLYEQMDVAATSITKNSTLRGTVLNLNIRDSQLTQQQMMEELEKTRTIQKTLINMMFSPIISNVLLYNRNLDYFYYTGLYLHDEGLLKRALSSDRSFEQLMETRYDQLYLGPHLSPWSGDDKVVLSAIRNFSDITTTQDTLVEIQVPYAHLDSICRQESFGDEKEIVILDSACRQIYPYEEAVTVLPPETIDHIVAQFEDGVPDFYSDEYAYYGSSILNNRFHVLLVSNQSTLAQYRKQNATNTILAVILILTTTCAIIFVIISIVSKPLNQMIRYINALSLDQDAPLNLSSDFLDEFELINSSFNQMLVKLKDSIKEVYEAQIRESNANLAALQAQINPHFLYNALNSISAASEIYGSEVTSRMCQQFSSMMRYITSSSPEAKLTEEIRHTRNYLDFMKISYDGSFDYTIDAPLETANLFLPRLTIEPLVENCFKHGFRECLPPWHITISCAIEGASWFIRIADNGSGFSPEALSDFQEFKDAYGSRKTADLYRDLEIDGLGLKNIYGRLFLYFNGNVDMYIENGGSRALCVSRPDNQNSPGGCLITIRGEITHD